MPQLSRGRRGSGTNSDVGRNAYGPVVKNSVIGLAAVSFAVIGASGHASSIVRTKE